MAQPDLSNIPTEDLQHIASGDMSKVSEPVLRYLAGQPQLSAAELQARMDKGSNGLGGTAGRVLETALSPLDAVASGVSHVASSTLAPPVALGARAVAAAKGGDQQAVDQASADAHKFMENQGTYHALTPGGKAVENDASAVAGAVTKPFQAAGDAIEGALPASVKPAVESAAGTANDILGSIPVVGAAGEIADAARAAPKTAGSALGFRAAGDSPVGKLAAGDSAGPALTAHNAQVGDAAISNEAGLKNGTTPSYEELEKARGPAEGVMDRVRANLPPEINLASDPETLRAINAAGAPEGGRITKGSPQAQQQIEDLRARLTDPGNTVSPMQLTNEMRALRQEGFTNSASDDVSNQQLGRAQLDMARALEGHVERNLNANGTVTIEDFQAARKALAKNYTAQSALRGNTFDLKTIARIQRADPQLLDGTMKDVADFANANPEVTGRANPLNAPSVAKDVTGVSITRPGTYLGPLTGAAGRRLLTGGQGVLDRTNRLFRANPPNQFPARVPAPEVGPPTPLAYGSHPDELPFHPGPVGPEAPLSASTPQAPSPTAAPSGGYSLADLLSHGVEQPPAPGLTAGPMGAPPAQGIPFTHELPPHLAGESVRDMVHNPAALNPELSLADALAGLQQHPAVTGATQGGLADVLSQGVPEGIAARTPPGVPRGRVPMLDFPSGAEQPRMLSNNASGESAASQEAINRGTRNLVLVDPDGGSEPLLRDSTQIDRKAPKGSIIVDADSGEIIDRGGMNQRGAEGLRNRYASRVKLGDHFTSR